MRSRIFASMRPWRGLGSMVAATVALGCFGVSASAQTSTVDAGAEYEAALLAYDTLLEDRETTFSRYEQALDRVDAARRAADEDARARAHASFQVVAFDLMDLEVQVEQAAARAALARSAYLRTLEVREEALLALISDDDGRSNLAEAALLEEWRQIRTRTLAVQADGIPVDAAELRPVPELTVDPRDGPVESLEKALFMEEQASSYDSLIVDLDSQVRDLERQMQQRQSVQDLLRDVGRFGSDFVQGDPPGLAPVPDAVPETGTTTSTADGVPDPDAALAQLPLPEQIALLRGARDLAIQYRNQALAMARVFRDRAEGMRP